MVADRFLRTIVVIFENSLRNSSDATFHLKARGLTKCEQPMGIMKPVNKDKVKQTEAQDSYPNHFQPDLTICGGWNAPEASSARDCLRGRTTVWPLPHAALLASQGRAANKYPDLPIQFIQLQRSVVLKELPHRTHSKVCP